MLYLRREMLKRGLQNMNNSKYYMEFNKTFNYLSVPAKTEFQGDNDL
jgi:hypothetical protein